MNCPACGDPLVLKRNLMWTKAEDYAAEFGVHIFAAAIASVILTACFSYSDFAGMAASIAASIVFYFYYQSRNLYECAACLNKYIGKRLEPYKE